jgi:hypothetical protein
MLITNTTPIAAGDGGNGGAAELGRGQTVTTDAPESAAPARARR